MNVPDPKTTALQLLEYCRARDWAGYDPYDALNSRLFEVLPFLNSRIPRLVMTQALKRSPVNLRPLLAIPKTQNPKGLGLFLGAAIKLARLGLLADDSLARSLAKQLLAARSTGTDRWCWGYSFPWQTRTIVVPRGSPNVVCTIFAAGAVLDYYEHARESRFLEVAISAARYVLDLVWRGPGGVASVSYPLSTLRSEIHNANLLAAALLCRVAKLSGEKQFIEPALELARYSASRQRDDGSWLYGELPKQAWIDNFHTGYNLSGLAGVGKDANTSEFDGHVRRGFDFYRRHFFREDGAPRYFHDRTYPIDAHCVSQSLITLTEFREQHEDTLRLARGVYEWAMANMWDERGFFYYRVLPFCRIKTSYMRWVQAWMLLGISTWLETLSGSVSRTAGAAQEPSPAVRP